MPFLDSVWDSNQIWDQWNGRRWEVHYEHLEYYESTGYLEMEKHEEHL